MVALPGDVFPHLLADGTQGGGCLGDCLGHIWLTEALVRGDFWLYSRRYV